MSGEGRRPVVTVDGPAGAGKTTTAKEVARVLGFRHLDSGALYRALTFALIEEGVPEAKWADLSQADLGALGVRLDSAPEGGFAVRVGDRTLGQELRSADVTDRVSLLARLPAARACLIDVQRAAGSEGGLIADGRDMGTVVFPDAEVKVFLVADLAERARRRLRDHGADAAEASSVEAEAASIARRDERDTERDISPLRRPDDAVEIDTSGLDFAEQVEAIVQLVRRLTLP